MRLSMKATSSWSGASISSFNRADRIDTAAAIGVEHRAEERVRRLEAQHRHVGMDLARELVDGGRDRAGQLVVEVEQRRGVGPVPNGAVDGGGNRKGVGGAADAEARDATGTGSMIGTGGFGVSVNCTALVV